MAGIIITAIAAILVILIIVKKTQDNRLMNSVTNKRRGTRAERRLVVSLLRNGVPADDIYHDLYLEYSPGYYSQIDVVVVSPFGLIVFEEKNYSGWIFGKGWQKDWTQVMNFGREKNHFFNPVKQNESHIRHLREALGSSIENVRVISYILFHGSCELRDVSEIPENTIVDYASNLSKQIKVLYSMSPEAYPDIEQVRRVLRQAAWNGGDSEIHKKHIANVERWKEES